MNEVKRIRLLGIIFAIIIGLMITIFILDKSSNKDEYKLYFLGRDDCGYCKLFKPNIDSIKEKYNIDYEYININEITSEELSKYIELFKFDASKFGTPSIGITKNGKYLDSYSGYLGEQELYEFLFKNNMINARYINNDYPNLKYINLSDYKKIVSSNDKKFIVLALEGCDDCEDAQSYLNDLAKDGLEVNYYNIMIDTEQDYEYFYNSYEFIKKSIDDNTLYTPTFIVVENKKVIDSLSEYDLEKLNELLKNNKLIK